MNPLLWLFDTIINLYIWIIIGQALLSILIAFNIVNSRQPFVAAVGEFLYRATEPVLGPIRKRLPNLGPVDLSPLVLVISLLFLQRIVHYVLRF